MRTLFFSSFLLLSCLFFTDCNNNSIKEISYRGISIDDINGSEGLYNPNRGFRLEAAFDVIKQKENPTKKLNALSDKYASDSVSLVQSYIYLTHTVGRDLTQEDFHVMQTYFDQLQKSGMKAVLRFAYERDFMGREAIGPTLEQALNHLDQLKPFLKTNSDLILVVQAGIIGAWGEWHSSVHNLHLSDEAKRAILQKILEIVPKELMVQVRVPTYKNLLKEKPDLYDRLSFHDDFIVIKPEPWDADMHEGTANFNQIVKESPYLVVDGELPWGFWSVGMDPDAPSNGWIIDGHETARRLFLQHFTSLSVIHNYKEQHPNKTFDEADAPKYSMIIWKETALSEAYLKQEKMPISSNYFEKRDGSNVERSVFDYIRDHLGYRIELQKIRLDPFFSLDKPNQLHLTLINRGFATVFGERTVQFVLIDKDDNVTEFPTEANPFNWQPYMPSDSTYTPLLHEVKTAIHLTGSLSPGKYRLGLWMPDASARLKYNHRYAIRCANGDLSWWISKDQKYGINILTEITVK